MGEAAQATGRPHSGVRAGPGASSPDVGPRRAGRCAAARCAGPGGQPGEGKGGGAAADPRVAGYVRVSQEKNVHKFGLDAQTNDVERYVEYRGWRPATIYREEGVSGYRRDRPTLELMLADARAQKAPDVGPALTRRAGRASSTSWSSPR